MHARLRSWWAALESLPLLTCCCWCASLRARAASRASGEGAGPVELWWVACRCVCVVGGSSGACVPDSTHESVLKPVVRRRRLALSLTCPDHAAQGQEPPQGRHQLAQERAAAAACRRVHGGRSNRVDGCPLARARALWIRRQGTGGVVCAWCVCARVCAPKEGPGGASLLRVLPSGCASDRRRSMKAASASASSPSTGEPPFEPRRAGLI